MSARERAAAVRSAELGGVGDQRRPDVCPNGTEGCPGAGGEGLPCAACFLSGGGA